MYAQVFAEWVELTHKLYKLKGITVPLVYKLPTICKRCVCVLPSFILVWLTCISSDVLEVTGYGNPNLNVIPTESQ